MCTHLLGSSLDLGVVSLHLLAGSVDVVQVALTGVKWLVRVIREMSWAIGFRVTSQK